MPREEWPPERVGKLIAALWKSRTLAEAAKKAGTSQAEVVRICRAQNIAYRRMLGTNGRVGRRK